MSSIDHAFAQRLEDAETRSTIAYAETKARLQPESHTAVLPIGDGVAIFTGPSSPINRVYGLGMHAPVEAPSVDAAEGFFVDRNVTPRIDLCPLADPSLSALLAARSYRPAGAKHVWWRFLQELADLPRPSEHVRVELVTAATAELWARVVAHSFSGARSLDDADIDIPWPTVNKPGTACYLAWIDEVPAGGGALAMQNGVAVLFSTSVRPALRRMGAHTALLHARLKAAAAAGCELAMVQTAPEGTSQRNVERFGFQLGYTKWTMESPDELGETQRSRQNASSTQT